MTLRRRMTLIVSVTVGAAILLASVIAYVAVRSELRGQVDDEFDSQLDRFAAIGTQLPGGAPPAPDLLRLGLAPDAAPAFFARFVSASGEVVRELGPGDVPVPAPDSVGDEPVKSDVEADGTHLRVLTTTLPDGSVVQIGRSLEDVDQALTNLRGVLFLVVMGGVALGAFGARLIANRMLAPVASLTDAAEHVSETEDLSRRIEVTGDAEVARLAQRFNAMLARLEGSRAALDDAHEEQRRLIADASHELRTPVTSLRTNIELIAGGKLEHRDVEDALADAVAQTEELGELIGDLMDLARGEAPELESEPVRLDEIVSGAVERARRHAPGARFALDAEPCVVDAAPDRIARAVNNLLDNAAEHADGAPVEVSVTAGTVHVRDHGAGIDAAEADRLFDRFYRGRGARRRPGSGLGLAIARQVAEAHGGTVSAANAPGGGAVFSLQLPQAPN